MKITSPTLLLLRGELLGYFKSKVMLVLWILMPLISIAGYLLVRTLDLRGAGLAATSAMMFVSILLSSIAGTVAAIMVAVDIVNERNRKVYDLFAIRPIRREALIWSKFFAVLGCVSIACVAALALGIALDAILGEPPTAAMLHDALESLATLIGVLATSTAGGVFIGVAVRGILVAVILVLYVGQNLPIVPLLPRYLGVLPDLFWVVILISLALAFAVVHAAAVMFRRAEL